ncbi:MAG: PQQ-dependent sugar dehydrogenase [Planctomycetota bacterium]
MRSYFLVACLLLGTAAAQPRLSVVRVATGLSRPVFVTTPPGDLDRLFVIEQHTGLVRVIKRGTLLPTPFLNVFPRILTGSERGLLGLAFDPLYATNGYFYLSYTRAGDGASILERFRVSSSNPDVADLSSGTVGFGPVTQPFSNHNGGCINFGPDGYLYFGLGDGGSAGDPSCNAQNPASHLGKMLRLDTQTMPFSAPASNPFVGNTAYRPEIWSLGWRNPWRWGFDRETGELFVGDVGQNSLEELDYEPAASGGRNYGWKVMEGTNCYSTAACTATVPACNSAALIRPFHTLPTASYCSIIGGYVYRGCNIPQLRGLYFFGDYCSGSVWSLLYANGTFTNLVSRNAELGALGAISSFGEDARGELYICGLGAGVLYKIVAADGGPGTDLGFGLIGSNNETPLFEICGRLEAGVSADFILRRAPASVPAVLAVSTTNNPTPILGGTLVPVPPQLLLPASTDASGSASLTVPGGVGPGILYAQWLMVDVGLPQSIGFSNAMRITFP